MTARKIKSLTLVIGNDQELVRGCPECPMFRDPDPYPCHCALDPQHGNYALSTKSVDVHIGSGPGIPDNCPLATFRVDVEREAEAGS